MEEGALRLAVEAEPRLLLAVEPPAATRQQPLTLAMLQEAKYSLFFLCALTRLAGQWRLALPHALPTFRQATAALLEFSSDPGAAAAAAGGELHCPPVSLAERAAAAAAGAGGGGADALQIAGAAAMGGGECMARTSQH